MILSRPSPISSALRGAFQRRGNQCLMHNKRRILRIARAGILIHHPRQQFGIEAAPVDPDTHRLVIFTGGFDQDGKLLVAFLAMPHITRD